MEGCKINLSTSPYNEFSTIGLAHLFDEVENALLRLAVEHENVFLWKLIERGGRHDI